MHLPKAGLNLAFAKGRVKLGRGSAGLINNICIFNCIILSKYKPHISQCVSPLRPGNNSATRSVDRPGPAARDASPAPAGNAASTKPWPGGGLRGVQQTKGVSWDRYR